VTGHISEMKLWDIRQPNALVHRFPRPFEQEIYTVGVSNSVIGCSGDTGYKLWDHRILDKPLEVHNDYITGMCVVFDVADSFIAAADDKGRMEILMNKSGITAEPLRMQMDAEVHNVGSDEKIFVLYNKRAHIVVYDFLHHESN